MSNFLNKISFKGEEDNKRKYAPQILIEDFFF